MAAGLAEEAMRSLTRAGSAYALSEEAAAAVEAKLRALKGKPAYQAELDGLVKLAYLLAEKKKSPAASKTLMEAVARVVKPKGPPKASAVGWGKK